MGIRIDPERIYHEHEVTAHLGIGFNELHRARKRGELRYKELSRGRRTYLGRWLLDWLTGPSEGRA